MKHVPFGETGLAVSTLSFGASSLGGVFHDVDEAEGIATVHAALAAGINYFDVAPAYGGTRAETVLGKALKDVERADYILSTKVGKHTDPNTYGNDTFDYSQSGIRRSLEESFARLNVEYVDICYLHDIEYENGANIEWAIDEGVSALRELKNEGRIRCFGFGIYPVELWRRLLTEVEFDAGLIHNHGCLNDTRIEQLLPLAESKGVGIVNASPYATGLLTDRGPADWHPASAEQRSIFKLAADHCVKNGTTIGKLAFQFSSQSMGVATTMFSTANRQSLSRSLAWHAEPYDADLVEEVRSILQPVSNIDWQWR